jgi:hypothetical protein
MPFDARRGDLITLELLERLYNGQGATGIRASGGINARQGPDGQIQIWGTPSAGAFKCQPSGAVAGATGTWPSITSASFTADIYQSINGVLNLVASSATVWNSYKSGLDANKTCTVQPDGSGNWDVIAQSCT